VGWALGVLGLGRGSARPGRQAVQQRFRKLLREAHPDHGGDAAEAALRISQLSEARRVLLVAK
jgi:curved DNA-binding protein CbpA